MTKGVSQFSTWFMGGLALLPGVLALFGWCTHNPALIRENPAFLPMQHNTALGFVVCGAGLLFFTLRLMFSARFAEVLFLSRLKPCPTI